ncbi:transmembrane epididymal protein 1-like [Hibiscus syriacus]|uniref:Transmembrane epididymal protein 1-like n=1 Tax=Hibiscus syriacus TaxID=106335 RepID=A0A6A2Z506_HIBSY|nr:transmembrane epididymal protein 1-like [Hibiscus syriacus]
MADKYGPTFLIRLGIHRSLVVSNWEVVKEFLTTNDKIFLNRPKSLAIKHMGYDHNMLGFAPYGPYWRSIRKLATVELLSNRRLELLKHVPDTEINSFIKELYELSVKNGGLFLFSDTVPFLGWLDVVTGNIVKIKQTAKELDFVIGSWLNEHRERRHNGDQDFIDVMLFVMDESNVPLRLVLPLKQLACLLLGGIDTNVVTLTWAVSLLLNNRNVLKKARDELDINVGKNDKWKIQT